MMWHSSSDKCALLDENKKKDFREDLYSAVSGDNANSSLHAVTPLMF